MNGLPHTHSLRWQILPGGHGIRVPRRSIGWIALGVTIVSASTYNGFAKVLSTALSPLSLLFLSESLTLAFVLVSFGLLPTLRKFLELPRRSMLPLFLLSMCSGFLAPLLLFAGLHRTSAVNASLFANSEMMFLLILAHFLLKERWSRRHAFGGACIAVGIATIALRGFTEGLAAPQAGDALILLAGLVFSVGSIVFRTFLHHLEPQIAMCARSTLAVASIFLLSPFVAHPLGQEVLLFPMVLVPALVGFGFLSRFLNVFSFYESLEHLPVSTVSLFSSLSTVGSVLFAAAYLREGILWYHILGGALIVLGSLLLQLLGMHPTEEHLAKHLKMQHRHG